MTNKEIHSTDSSKNLLYLNPSNNQKPKGYFDMASKGLLVWSVVLRFLTVAALVASIAVLVTNKFTSSDDGSNTTFKDVITYRFILAIAGIGVLYSLYQIPFAIYHAHKEKRLTRNDCAPEFEFYGDKIMSFLLATSVGAGFAATYELKRVLKRFTQTFGTDEDTSKQFDFLNRGYVAIGLLLVGFLSEAILSVFSSMTRTNKSKGFFG